MAPSRLPRSRTKSEPWRSSSAPTGWLRVKTSSASHRPARRASACGMDVSDRGQVTSGASKTFRTMAFAWRDPDQLHVLSSMFGRSEGWTIRDLPRWLGMGLYSYEIEGDPELLKTEVGGDWIVRKGVAAEELVQPLEAILQRAIRQRITLALCRVEREVVVARGRYRPSPLPGRADGEIEVYAREPAQEDERGDGVGDFPSFLRGLAVWIGRPILNEVESPPKGNIGWHYDQREASAERTRRGDEELVLKHLKEQTGLTFAREKTDPNPIRRAGHCIQIIADENRCDTTAWRNPATGIACDIWGNNGKSSRSQRRVAAEAPRCRGHTNPSLAAIRNMTLV